MMTFNARSGALALCALLAAAIGSVSFAGSSEASAWGVRASGPTGAESAVVEKAQYYRYRRYYPRCRTQCVTWSRYGCLRWRTYCY
jgi:hypothetical protein